MSEPVASGGELAAGGGNRGPLGQPREHHQSIDSTNRRARELAASGAAHGTLVTAAEQTVGRGRQGRTWSSPPGASLSMSLVLREPPPLPSLAAGVAVAAAIEWSLRDRATDATGAANPTTGADPTAVTNPNAGANPAVATNPTISIKWPNDILLDGRKVAGILVEGAPQQYWAVLGIGINVALSADELPPELADRATTLGLGSETIEPILARLLTELERWLPATQAEIVAAVRARDALRGQPISWNGGAERGTAIGIDDQGRLLARSADGGELALDAGEVHLERG